APTDAQEVHHVRAIVGVAVAGAIGALIRWGLGTAIGQRFPQFPWATMVINVTGSFLLGLLFVVLTERTTASPAMRLTLTTGLMGAYTTFSTFSLETFRLMEDGAYAHAGLNVAGNVVLGLVAVAFGIGLGRAM
ncbi:MAG: fluoride efflux transporter CrcB, partial [Myxococcota bacterium]